MAQNVTRMTPPMELLLRVRRGFRSAEDSRIRRRLLATPRSAENKSSLQSSDNPTRATRSSAYLTPSRGSPMLLTKCRNVSSTNRLAPGSASPLLKQIETVSPTKRGDRFIPARSKMNLDQSNFLLLNKSPCKIPTPTRKGIPTIKVLQFSMNSPDDNCSKEIPSTIGAMKEVKIKEIKTPDKVLDAPGVLPDHSLQLLDCSSQSIVALALDCSVYVWDSKTKKTSLLCNSLLGFNITCVKWSPDSDILAVASSDGRFTCWTRGGEVLSKLVCRYTVTALAWNGRLLTCGDTTGYIRFYDLDNTYPSFPVSVVKNHSAAILALSWNKQRELLSSGCASGQVKIWTLSDYVKPLHVLDRQRGRITVTEWCIWLNSVLAVGTQSGRIILIRTRDKAEILSVTVCATQVTDLKWSEGNKEILSSHCSGEINFWAYPLMTNMKRITGHEGCILGLSLGPEPGRILSLGQDETLRIWNCLKVNEDFQQAKTPLKMCLR